MSHASPSDLAVAYRSMPRRLHEALDGCDDAHTWSGHGRMTSAMAEAALLLGTDVDAAAVAEAIDARHLDDWQDADLRRLETLALQLGALVREAAAWCEESPRD